MAMIREKKSVRIKMRSPVPPVQVDQEAIRYHLSLEYPPELWGKCIRGI